MIALALLCAAIAAITDLRDGFIYDRLTIPAAVLLAATACTRDALPAAIAGALACGGALLILHGVTRGRGVGLGDVKLAAVVGAGLGLPYGLIAIGAAFVAGTCVALPLLVLRRVSRRDRLPFAPFIAAGTIAASFCPGGALHA